MDSDFSSLPSAGGGDQAENGQAAGEPAQRLLHPELAHLLDDDAQSGRSGRTATSGLASS